MVIAHVNYFFVINNDILFIIGRIAFLLFAWLIANGAHHTKNIYSYLKRIFLFAIISQVPFILANQKINPDYWRFNILFTFALSLLVIIVFRKTKNLLARGGFLLLILLFAELIKTDYGAEGILSVVMFYIFFNSKFKTIVSQIALYSIGALVNIYFLTNKSIENISYYLPYLLLALPFIYFYNGKEGIKAKYLFYIFYPLHYLIIYLLLNLT